MSIDAFKSADHSYFILTWDWKEGPNEAMEDFLRIINVELFTPVCGYEIDTGGDYYAVVLSEIQITKEEAEAVYQGYINQ